MEGTKDVLGRRVTSLIHIPNIRVLLGLFTEGPDVESSNLVASIMNIRGCIIARRHFREHPNRKYKLSQKIANMSSFESFLCSFLARHRANM